MKTIYGIMAVTLMASLAFSPQSIASQAEQKMSKELQVWLQHNGFAHINQANEAGETPLIKVAGETLLTFEHFTEQNKNSTDDEMFALTEFDEKRDALAEINKNMIKELVGLGVDVNHKDLRGHTALMKAIIAHNEFAIAFLLKHGADAAIITKHDFITDTLVIPAGCTASTIASIVVFPMWQKLYKTHTDALFKQINAGVNKSLSASQPVINLIAAYVTPVETQTPVMQNQKVVNTSGSKTCAIL